VLPGLLAAGLFAVSLADQYRCMFGVRHLALVLAIEAIGLDAYAAQLGRQSRAAAGRR